MDDAAPLDSLCARCGIEAQYTDLWGQRHAASEQTRLALLRAMGVPIENPAGARAALEALDSRAWRDPVAPATVCDAGAAPRIVFQLAGALAAPAIEWRLDAEKGERAQGRLEPAALELLETRDIAGTVHGRYAFTLPAVPTPGYHRLRLSRADTGQDIGSTLLIACPDRCFQPESIALGTRIWGPAIQLYALRSRRNWGMGDFTDLGNLCELVAGLGAGIVGVNPLHALFAPRPEDASPYNPSSRMALNVLYLDVEAIADYRDCPAALQLVGSQAFHERLQALREPELVDYAGVAAAKFQVLELLYRHFRERELARDTERSRAFRAFQSAGGEPLRLHALFEALLEYLSSRDPGAWGWPAWPESYRHPSSPEVQAFFAQNAERVEYVQYLQWQADLQLKAASGRARALGMTVGLYTDVAVGANPGGAETWMRQACYAVQAGIGAPPDEFNLAGQSWGLTPFIPHALAQAAYEPYVAMLRSGMRCAGAIRIDHVMALMRLYWIPADGGAREGTYVRYPMEDLFRILALESHRNRCLVIGEDLGTVPPEVRDAMSRYGMFRYRPLYFERGVDGGFRAPKDFPADALVALSTHDLPTLRGFWQAADLAARDALGLFPNDEARAQALLARAQDRVRLLLALERAALVPPGTSVSAPTLADIDQEMVNAVHAFIARTPSRILVVQLEDLLGQVMQANLPATTEAQHPNWRRKLSSDIEDWPADERITGLARILCRERGLESVPQKSFPASRGPRVVPRVTYRLQFRREFTFEHARERVPYLAALGVSHIYASPFLKARAGSTHGYDIIDHNALNPEIGSDEQLGRLIAALKEHGMGLMMDIVPNHMGVMEADNAWWLDVLENGPAAPHASYFDIEWEPANEVLRGKVLLPVLGAQYGLALDQGELKLRFDAKAAELSVWYCSHRFPIDPREYPRILQPGLERLEAQLGSSAPLFAEFASLVASFGHLPARSERRADTTADRLRDKTVRKHQLAELCERSDEIRRYIDESVAAFEGTPGQPESFDRLHELMEAQAWRVAHWRVAGDDINYRRFFDIHDLAALRMESEAVFEDTHRLVLRLVHEGKVDALRVDHPDGLYDPAQYFERLQRRAAPSGAGASPGEKNIYIAVEKVLAQHERLPESWPVHATTGYRFLNLLNGLFVDAASDSEMERAYTVFLGRRIDYDELLHECKVLIMTNSLSSEMGVLATTLNRIAKADRRHRDFTLNSLRRALVEIVANFPVYRTYSTGAGMREEDRRYVDWAVAKARKRARAAESSVYDFIRDVLLGTLPGHRPAYTALVEGFVRRFQQFTSPVMAKAVEDTSFYIYNRLVSLNEVGGDPRTFGISLKAFHAASADRARSWPHTMLATSTHDNKRSEDVRARINVLSEAPAAWRLALRRWSRLNQRKKIQVGDEPAPSKNDEYLLYQTLLGAWPLEPMDAASLDVFRERIEKYMLKAVREAKVKTSWINPNEEYERGLSNFIGALLKSLEGNPFLNDFLPVQQRIARCGMLNSLSQTLIKLASPGVPDIYQGNELWDLSLVDPDNRRPVDYDRRVAALEQMRQAAPHELASQAAQLLSSMHDGRVKQYVTWKTLGLRAHLAELFAQGEYIGLFAQGAKSEHVCGFARRHEGRSVIAIAPRLVLQLTSGGDRLPLGEEVWEDTSLPLPAGGSYVDAFTGARHELGTENAPALSLSRALSVFPVALLESNP